MNQLAEALDRVRLSLENIERLIEDDARRHHRIPFVANKVETEEQTMQPLKKVGLLCGREYSFPPAFIARVNQLGKADGVAAEFVKLGGTKMNEPAEYSVIVDRISHEVDYYRGYLKHAVLQGTYVINNPFWWTADVAAVEDCAAAADCPAVAGLLTADLGAPVNPEAAPLPSISSQRGQELEAWPLSARSMTR